MSISVSKAMNAFSADLIRACASKYGFDGEEAMRELSVSIAAPTKKASKAKVPKAAAHPTPSIPLPFTGTIRDDCCNGVKQNHGLYTQCFSAVVDAGLCKGCNKQASKNASGEPDCGLIAKRVMQGDEYRDAKGRGPVHYTKVMKKQKLTEEQVLAEASKFGIEIDASHFVVPETKRGRPKKATTSDTESDTSSAGGEKKKARGRPKKAAKVVEVNATEDLFASLMQQAQSASPRPPVAGGSAAVEVEEDVSDVSSGSDSETEAKPLKKTKKQAQHKEESEEALAEKATKFLEKEDEKEKKAAAKAAAKEAEKQEKAAAKLAQKEAEKATKEAAKALAEQEKAAKKPEAKKKTKAAAATVVPAVQEPVADLESEAESEDDKPVVTVKKFEHGGVNYLKSSDGVLYDTKSQEVVGKWNETTKSIDVYDGESEEEEEDSDDEDE